MSQTTKELTTNLRIEIRKKLYELKLDPRVVEIIENICESNFIVALTQLSTEKDTEWKEKIKEIGNCDCCEDCKGFNNHIDSIINSDQQK